MTTPTVTFQLRHSDQATVFNASIHDDWLHGEILRGYDGKLIVQVEGWRYAHTVWRQHVRAVADDRLRELARDITPRIMLDTARLNTGWTIGHLLAGDRPEECDDLTDAEAAMVADLVDDLAARADITITLPADTEGGQSSA